MVCEKDTAIEFAEKLAVYFKEKYEYDHTPIEEDCYDFHGMVVLWNIGDKSLIANINLIGDLGFWKYEKDMPDELYDSFENSQLQQLLYDGDDNSINSLMVADIDDSINIELFSCVAEDFKPDYIEIAKEEGIEITN